MSKLFFQSGFKLMRIEFLMKICKRLVWFFRDKEHLELNMVSVSRCIATEPTWLTCKICMDDLKKIKNLLKYG